MTRPAAWIAVVLALVAAAGCRSTVDPLAQDLTPDQYFQRAIEASDKDNYRLALRYYEAFQAKFPNDAARNIWASYEIALLHHKLGDDDKAIELFDQLLARYENQPADAPPLPPRAARARREGQGHYPEEPQAGTGRARGGACTCTRACACTAAPPAPAPAAPPAPAPRHRLRPRLARLHPRHRLRKRPPRPGLKPAYFSASASSFAGSTSRIWLPCVAITPSAASLSTTALHVVDRDLQVHGDLLDRAVGADDAAFGAAESVVEVERDQAARVVLEQVLDLRVHVLQAPAELVDDVERDLGVLRHHAEEPFAVEREQVHLRQRRHRRGPPDVVDDRHLAEEIALCPASKGRARGRSGSW